MPSQVMPTAHGFAWLKRELEKLGFHQLSPLEAYLRIAPFLPKRRQNMGAASFKKRAEEGREAGFVHTANGLDVIVWTTWLVHENRPRQSDSGWVLISKGRKALYFATPRRRTQEFLERILNDAAIAQRRIDYRPHCQYCNALMDIVPGPKLKERYWRCDNVADPRHHRGLPASRRWDIALTPVMQAYVDQDRAERARSHDRAIKAGKQPHAAMLNKVRWEDRVTRGKK